MHRTQDLPCPPQGDDEEEPLGTVCECCWKNIPDPEDVWYAEDGTAMCESCFRYHEGEVCTEEKRKEEDDDRFFTTTPMCPKNLLRSIKTHLSPATGG